MTPKERDANQPAVEDFRETLRGELIQSEEEGYDETRTIWNAMIDRRPAVIARCAGAADVITAADFARENDLRVAVHGGGHNIAGDAVCDGGLMIDLSPMDDVRVDPEAQTARVGPGATWADVDHETQAFGLAVPSGVVSTTGVAGLTLGGGFGRLSRKYGLTADNLLSAGVVTAAGEFLTASETENEDLFWGLRGGGGNFGIVTSFEFQLHEVGPEVLFGPIVYEYDDAPDVLRHYREVARDAPAECSVWVDSLTAPPLPFLPEDVHGSTVLFVAPFYAGDLDTGQAVLEPLRDYDDPIADAVEVTQYTVSQQAIDDLYDEGVLNYWKSHNFIDLSDEALDTIVEYAQNLPTPGSDILISHVGGAINDVEPDATAYPHRTAEFIVTPGARWEDPARDEECISWVRECYDDLAEFASGGTYVNFISERDGRETDAYGRNYERMVALKNRYDPENLFRLNQNVEPTY